MAKRIYTIEETEKYADGLLKELNQDNINKLYKADSKRVKHSNILNWNGVTKDDSSKYYINIISEKIYPKVVDMLKKIPFIDRKNGFPKRKKGEKTRIGKFKISERDIAECIELNDLGDNIEFEIPLNAKRSDRGVGKIDFLTYNKDTDTITIVELKAPNSTEGLLRAAFEIQTYYQQFSEEFFNKFLTIKLCKKIQIKRENVKKAVVLFNNTCEISNEANDLYKVAAEFCDDKDSSKFEYLAKIFDDLEIDLYIYETPETPKDYENSYKNLKLVCYRKHNS